MTTGPASSLIPVTLLTGFLGNGKTTVLNHRVRQPELVDARVILNAEGEGHRSRLVFVTQDVGREVVDRTFEALRQALPQAGPTA